MFNPVSAAQVPACLREAFGLWGRPGGLKLDNGLPWGGWNDLPTALALWLAGLGIELHFIPPGQKQLNGVVEKSHDTGQRWAEPHTCASPEELQARLASAGVPAGTVRSVDEVYGWDQTLSQGLLVDVA